MFTNRSKAVLLLWIVYVICVLFCYAFMTHVCLLYCLASSLQPAVRGLTSWFSCMLCSLVFCHFPIWCPGLGVVFNCIDSFTDFILKETENYYVKCDYVSTYS